MSRQRRTASPWQPRGNGEHVLSVGDVEAVIFQAADGAREWNVAIGGRVCTNAHGREGFPSRAQAEDVAFTRATIAARKRA